MKKMKLLIVSFVLVATMLCGCGSSSGADLNTVIYADYVKGIMDCSYKADFESYTKVCDATTDEAKEVYDSTIEYYASELMYYNGVAYDYISDELKQKYIDLAADLMNKCKYTVNDAVKVDDEYQVKIEIEPLDINDISYDEIEAYMTEYNKMAENTDFTTMSEEAQYELEEAYALSIYNILESYVDKVGYKSVKSKIVIIEFTEDGTYGIDDEDWYDIDDYVVDMQ